MILFVSLQLSWHSCDKELAKSKITKISNAKKNTKRKVLFKNGKSKAQTHLMNGKTTVIS